MHKCTEYGTPSLPRGKLASVHVIMKEHNQSQAHIIQYVRIFTQMLDGKVINKSFGGYMQTSILL